MVDYNQYRMEKKEALTFWLLFITVVLLAGELFFRAPLYGLLLLLFGKPVKKEYCRHLGEKKKKTLLYQFRDLLYSLSASIAAGHPMREALMEAESTMRMVYPGEASICIELAAMRHSMEETAESEASLLTDFARRSHIPDVLDFASVYSICRQTGGNLEYAMLKATGILMDRIDFSREMETLTAQKKLEIRILMGMPVALIALLRLFSPGYLEPMYETAEGMALMVGCLGLMVVVFFWCNRLLRVDL